VTNTPGGAIVNANVANLQGGTGITIDNNNGTWTINAPGSGSASLGTSGWQEFPSGLIMQWGFGTIPPGTGTTVIITLPRAFPNNIWNVQATNRAPGTLSWNMTNIDWSLDQIRVGRGSALSNVPVSFWWQALGN
jgi:hypothetical protein